MPSLADTESAGEESLGRLAEGGPGSTTFSAIFNSFLDNHSEQRDGGESPQTPTSWGRALGGLRSDDAEGRGAAEFPFFRPWEERGEVESGGAERGLGPRARGWQKPPPKIRIKKN